MAEYVDLYALRNVVEQLRAEVDILKRAFKTYDKAINFLAEQVKEVKNK